MIDVLIVGGGPAGLSAALILGRCRRRVQVIDEGKQRNLRSRQVNGFLTRDGTPPMELLEKARAEVRRYGVELVRGEAIKTCKIDRGFEVTLADRTIIRARRLLLATGACDRIPNIPGLDELYGTSVHHCPYCDGYEHRDRRLIALGTKADFALGLLTWSDKVVACTNGRELSVPDDSKLLARNRIALRREKIARLEGQNGELSRVIFEDGEALEADALFFHEACFPECELADQLGAKSSFAHGVETGELEQTEVFGLYVAGDASKDVLFAIVAAAEGAKAAYDINRSLRLEDQA